MKAVVFHDIGDIRLEQVKDPVIKNDFDAIVRITASAICGTDLHMVRGTLTGMKSGTILGHEGVGIVAIWRPATVSSFRQQSGAVTARTAAPDTTANVTMPIQTDLLLAQPFSAVRSKVARSMDCRPRKPSFRLQISIWSSFRKK